MVRFQVLHQLQIPAKGQILIDAALHQDTGAVNGLELPNLLADFFKRQRVRVLLVAGAVKAAKRAADVTDIRVVDVAVNQVGDDLRVGATLPDGVGGGGEVKERQIVKFYGFLGG